MTTTPLEKSLPPNDDSMAQHTKRANYQAGVWRLCLIPMTELPPPQDHGWLLHNNKLPIQWLTKPSAPPELLQLNNCKCEVSNCLGGRCSCNKANMKCTPLCMCKSCENSLDEEEEEAGGDEDDEDEENE